MIELKNYKGFSLKSLSPVQAHVLKNEDGRCELAIVIDDDTTIEQIKKAWPSITERREKIRRQQGTDLGAFRNYMRYSIACKVLREGFSYAEVAMDVNYDCLVNLCRVADTMTAGSIPNTRESYQAAYGLLASVGMKKKDIHDCLNAGLEAIQRGESPWSLTDGPVKKQRIVDALRQLNREVENGKVIIRQMPQTKLMSIRQLLKANKVRMSIAEELLKQLPKSGGLDRLLEAHRRHVDSRVKCDSKADAQVQVIAYRG